MDKLMVYFHNGCRAQFDMDRVLFLENDGGGFGLIDSDDDALSYAEILDSGIAIVNWNNVSFVQKMKEEEEENG